MFVAHQESLQDCCIIITDNADLSHMRDIKEADTLSAMQVLLYDNFGIENGHAVSGK
jgi:ribosomal protein L30E